RRAVLGIQARAARLLALARGRPAAARRPRALRPAGLRRNAGLPAARALAVPPLGARRAARTRGDPDARRGRAPPPRDLRPALVPPGGVAPGTAAACHCTTTRDARVGPLAIRHASS